MEVQKANIYRFGPFILDIPERRLLKDGEPVALTPKAFDTLTFLVERPQQLVRKEELMEHLWPNSFVEENSLAQNIHLLRRSLGDGSNGQKYIETVPRLGYRLTVEVNKVTEIPLLPETAVTKNHESIAEESLGHHSKASFYKLNRAWVIVSLLLVVVCLAGVLYFFITRTTKQYGQTLEVTSIAVLPFRSYGSEGEEAHLGLGMTDAMIIKLGSINRITVRPTNSITKYATGQFDPLAVGRELGVDAIVQGTVQKSGDRVRVTIQMTDLRSGQQIWSDQFDGAFTDVFAVQDTMSERVVEALAIRLTGEEKKNLGKHYTEDAEAYEAYLRGIYFTAKRTRENLARGIDYFNEAIRRDPDYAMAYAGLADAYVLAAYYDGRPAAPGDNYEKARDAAAKALSLDDKIAEAYTVMALVSAYVDNDAQKAEQQHRHSIAINSNLAISYQRYAVFLLEEGRLDEALYHIEQAQAIDPLSMIINMNCAAVLYFRRDIGRAERYAWKAAETEPGMPGAKYWLGLIYQQQNKIEEALTQFELGRKLDVNKFSALDGIGHAYAAAGRRKDALRVIDELKEAVRLGAPFQWPVAIIYAELGDMDQAFAWLEKQNENWRRTLYVIRFDPRFDKLRQDPRYKEFMKQKFQISV